MRLVMPISALELISKIEGDVTFRRLFGIAVGKYTPLFAILYLSGGIAIADVIPPKVNTTTITGISIADTEFRVDVTDITIGSLKLNRFSQSPSKFWQNYPQFGMMMSSNFDIYVQNTFIRATGQPFPTQAHYHVTVHMGNSAVGVYSTPSLNGTGSVTRLSGDAGAGILAWSGTAYQFTNRSGDVYTFSPGVSAHPASAGIAYGSPGPTSQRVDHINYADGRVSQFYYDASQRVKLVTDSGGYAILFDYGANGFVSNACGIDRARSYVTASSTCAGRPLTVSYQYGTATSAVGSTVSVLIGVTDVRGQTTSFARFSNNPSISCIKPPGYSACQMQLSATTSGISQALADGSIWSFASDQGKYAVNDPEVPADTSYGASITDPAGHTTSYIFAGSSPLRITDANNKTTLYKWCCSQLSEVNSPQTYDGMKLLEADLPEGNKYFALYGGPFGSVTQERMQAKAGSGSPDQVVTYSYDAAFASGVLIAKPTAKTDANGNQTNWTYTSFGAVASEMKAAPAFGAARPLKLSVYVQRYAYILNASGSLVASGSPVWMLSTETECQTVAGSATPVCDGGAPQRVTAYQYGADGTPDNLLVHGMAVTADGQTLTTCYGYDAQSRKISTTSPRAGLAVCP